MHRVRVLGYKTFGLSLKWGWGRTQTTPIRLPVAELLFVREGLECLISHTMHPVHSRTEHGIAKNDYGSYDRVVLKISKNYKRIILKPSWECQNLIVAK